MSPPRCGDQHNRRTDATANHRPFACRLCSANSELGSYELCWRANSPPAYERKSTSPPWSLPRAHPHRLTRVPGSRQLLAPSCLAPPDLTARPIRSPQGLLQIPQAVSSFGSHCADCYQSPHNATCHFKIRSSTPLQSPSSVPQAPVSSVPQAPVSSVPQAPASSVPQAPASGFD
jgi:DNA-directed RNA polymerase II subunit RPB1